MPVDVASILIFLVVGLIVGWLADVLVKGVSFGIVGDLVVGVVGALLGGLLFSLIGIEGGFWISILAALVGAVILLFIIRAVQTTPRRR